MEKEQKVYNRPKWAASIGARLVGPLDLFGSFGFQTCSYFPHPFAAAAACTATAAPPHPFSAAASTTDPECCAPTRPLLSRSTAKPANGAPLISRFDLWMASSVDAEGVTASMGELSVEASPSSSGTEIAQHANGDVAAAAEYDDIWDDASDSPGHASNLDREWIHRQNQFQKMGYRDGITEGQKDSAQEGFNIGFRQSVNVGYKWGLVRGVTSALASLPDSLKEKLVPGAQCRSKLQDLHRSVQEISADDALQIFHESICQSNHPSEESHVTSTADGATESNRITNLSKDVVLLLRECPDVKVSGELA